MNRLQGFILRAESGTRRAASALPLNVSTSPLRGLKAATPRRTRNRRHWRASRLAMKAPDGYVTSPVLAKAKVRTCPPGRQPVLPIPRSPRPVTFVGAACHNLSNPAAL